MADICCEVVSDNETAASSTQCEPSTRAGRVRRFKFIAGSTVPDSSAEAVETEQKRQKFEEALTPPPLPRDCVSAVKNCGDFGNPRREYPKFGMASVCGRRRDMEDAVAIHPSFCSELHYYAVYDGHGCSHVATKCRERLHELVKEELGKRESMEGWDITMERSFRRMDKEAISWPSNGGADLNVDCRCELQTPECDAVGSTAVVAIVTPDKIIVANCGDSRAVLCRNGKAIPLSYDHKPDRPDELNRIQEAGGRVIYWEGPRVLGVLAMSRAIGDNYLKPYVSCEPEVTITDRTAEDECLIVASDGLWDVVPNDTACGVARMCLRGKFRSPSSSEAESGGGGGGEVENSDKACSDASMLLTKLALARHTTDNVSVVVVDLKKNT
ncbi:PPM-type phosphatase-like domain [Dillenia turbinata]|uniref:protein-serine/threonine phosphatase n=1 Tax=Dillenia turbinata TaxID=194707 RepID=A0AAN8VU53_9MAGN